MSVVNTSPTLEQSHPLSTQKPLRSLIENIDDNSQAHDTFLQHLMVKPIHYQHRTARKSNTNYASSVGSIVDRAPSSLFELKQQRLLAAADRKKRIIARIVSVVGLLIILLCAAIVTLTLKMAPKIDELVRTRAGAHQLIHLVSRINTPPTTTTTTTITTLRQDNYTINGSIIEKSIFRTRRKAFI
jgi:hypothetical protein